MTMGVVLTYCLWSAWRKIAQNILVAGLSGKLFDKVYSKDYHRQAPMLNFSFFHSFLLFNIVWVETKRIETEVTWKVSLLAKKFDDNTKRNDNEPEVQINPIGIYR